MGKKMKLPFLFQSKTLDPKLFPSSSSSSSSSSPPWPFPSCGNIRTLSFRANNDNDDAFRTFNSAFLEAEVTPPESYFTISSSSRSFSTMSEDSGDPLESVIRGLSSDRLFFEPEWSNKLLLHPSNPKLELEPEPEPEEEEEEQEEESPSINPASKDPELVASYKESEMLPIDSISPYEDFRRSMEEMVEAHEVKDWQGLEELLGCYLKINGKNNHGYIIGAFIDLLVNFSFESSSTSTTTTTTTTSTSTSNTNTNTNTLSSTSYSNYSSPSSPLSLPSSSLTTPCLSSILDRGNIEVDDEEEEDDDDDDDL